jgi:hypothetical protein
VASDLRLARKDGARLAVTAAADRLNFRLTNHATVPARDGTARARFRAVLAAAGKSVGDVLKAVFESQNQHKGCGL